MKIRHLSVTVKNPERSATILAEMTGGSAEVFPSQKMQGAWVCIWDETKNNLVEFLPNEYLMYPTEYGADFRKFGHPQNFNSTHFLLEIDFPLIELQKVPDKYKCRHSFRPRFGGPLYDVWIEDQLLVEFISDEIKNMV